MFYLGYKPQDFKGTTKITLFKKNGKKTNNFLPSLIINSLHGIPWLYLPYLCIILIMKQPSNLTFHVAYEGLV